MKLEALPIGRTGLDVFQVTFRLCRSVCMISTPFKQTTASSLPQWVEEVVREI
jgi:hypothetical protein